MLAVSMFLSLWQESVAALRKSRVPQLRGGCKAPPRTLTTKALTKANPNKKALNEARPQVKCSVLKRGLSCVAVQKFLDPTGLPPTGLWLW